MKRRIRVLGIPVVTIETPDPPKPEDAPDFTATAHPAGFTGQPYDTRPRPGEEPDGEYDLAD